MGLDTVELIIEVEETFGIAIANRDAEQIRTAGELHQHVLKKLAGMETLVCPSAATFYRFRRALRELLGIERERVRPLTPVEDLIPLQARRDVWHRLERTLELTFPALEYPSWIDTAILFELLAVIPLTGVAVLAAAELTRLTAVVLLFVIALSVATLSRIARCFELGFSAECRTVRGLIQTITRRHYGRTEVPQHPWNEREVWEVLRALIVRQLGVKPEEVTESARIVDDLGAN